MKAGGLCLVSSSPSSSPLLAFHPSKPERSSPSSSNVPSPPYQSAKLSCNLRRPPTDAACKQRAGHETAHTRKLHRSTFMVDLALIYSMPRTCRAISRPSHAVLEKPNKPPLDPGCGRLSSPAHLSVVLRACRPPRGHHRTSKAGPNCRGTALEDSRHHKPPLVRFCRRLQSHFSDDADDADDMAT
ncbi:hypothetical protein BDZ97DRAFT_531757 [Flammula alnicola]|nr:hypothetical protein BDZ97DRAFT_531757 [Flammula alnicola]